MNCIVYESKIVNIIYRCRHFSLQNCTIYPECSVFKIPFQGQHGTNRRASDANYDPVQMDMSEV